MFGRGHTRIVIRTRQLGRREIATKGRPDPLAAKVVAFVRGLPIRRGTIRIERMRSGAARLIFSRGIDESLRQRVRNYALSLSSR